jgi:hypothetical protein
MVGAALIFYTAAIGQNQGIMMKAMLNGLVNISRESMEFGELLNGITRQCIWFIKMKA